MGGYDLLRTRLPLRRRAVILYRVQDVLHTYRRPESGTKYASLRLSSIGAGASHSSDLVLACDRGGDMT